MECKTVRRYTPFSVPNTWLYDAKTIKQPDFSISVFVLNDDFPWLIIIFAHGNIFFAAWLHCSSRETGQTISVLSAVKDRVLAAINASDCKVLPSPGSSHSSPPALVVLSSSRDIIHLIP